MERLIVLPPVKSRASSLVNLAESKAIAFGRGTLQGRIFAWHVNEVRRSLGLPQVTQAAAGNPTMEEKMNILRSAVEKLDDEAQAILIQVLLRSPMYASVQSGGSDQEGDNNVGDS